MMLTQWQIASFTAVPVWLQVDVGIAWISALATLILVPSDIYHAMQACCVHQSPCAMESVDL